MDFQKIIVTNADGTVLDKPLCLLDHRGEVEALVDIVHMESIVFHILYQVGCAVAVKTDLQRVDLVYLHQFSEPVEAVMIIHKILTGWKQQSPLDIGRIR